MREEGLAVAMQRMTPAMKESMPSQYQQAYEHCIAMPIVIQLWELCYFGQEENNGFWKVSICNRS